ncbi:MAG: hypothetical protein ACI90V_013068, partial [Bacillariaceae sp.]
RCILSLGGLLFASDAMFLLCCENNKRQKSHTYYTRK